MLIITVQDASNIAEWLFSESNSKIFQEFQNALSLAEFKEYTESLCRVLGHDMDNNITIYKDDITHKHNVKTFRVNDEVLDELYSKYLKTLSRDQISVVLRKNILNAAKVSQK